MLDAVSPQSPASVCSTPHNVAYATVCALAQNDAYALKRSRLIRTRPKLARPGTWMTAVAISGGRAIMRPPRARHECGWRRAYGPHTEPRRTAGLARMHATGGATGRHATTSDWLSRVGGHLPCGRPAARCSDVADAGITAFTTGFRAIGYLIAIAVASLVYAALARTTRLPTALTFLFGSHFRRDGAVHRCGRRATERDLARVTWTS